MSHKYVEKSFLYLLVFSLILHVGVAALLWYLPEQKPPAPKEPVFVDLQQIPDLPRSTIPSQREVRRQSDRRRRVERETAPRGYDSRDTGARPSRPAEQPRAATGQTAPSTPSQPGATARQKSGIAERSPVSDLLKPRSQAGRSQGQARLFPGARGMASLEETYRRKYEKDIADGTTRFLDTDDIQFGSFLHHFEEKVYGVWRYPEEAARKGITGITPVKITFNRQGRIISVKLLENSGSKILDDEVFRTLNLIDQVGSFPKGYDKDEFHLIAFFQYGMTRKAIR